MEEYREMTSETVDRVEMAEAIRILQKLKGERLSHARKLDPCELYEFLFGTYEVTWQQDEQGRSGKCVRFTDCLYILCDLKICGTHLTGWSMDAQFQAACCPLIGSEVTNVSAGRYHVLKLPFPQGEMRVYPLRDGEEAWRFSSQDRQQPHLVASFRPNGTGRPDAVSPQRGPDWEKRLRRSPAS